MASLTRKIAANTAAQMTGKAASTVLGVVITILLTRYLGPAGFGTFTFILVFVTMFGTAADWGLTLITVREASQDARVANEIIGNVLVIRLLLAALAAAVAVAVMHLLPYDPLTQTLVLIASLTLLAISLKTSFQIIFNVKLRMENTAISDFCANLLTMLLVFGVINFNWGITGVVLAYLAGDIFSALVAGFLGFRLLPIRLSLAHPATRYLLLESLPMGAILVTFTIYNRIDTVILSAVKGDVAVGFYGAAYRIFEVLVLGAAYFSNAILPLISNLAQHDRVKLGEIYRKAFVVLLLLGSAVAAVNYLLAPLGIALIAGAKFAPAVPALQILSLALVVSYLNHLNGYTLIALGKQWWSFVVAIGALFLNVGLNWILIPYFSLYGAAAITFVTEGSIALASVILIHKMIGVSPRPGDIFAVGREIITKKGKIFE
ncbi:MAG: flippase [Patescibacteria group bacterium]|nr:flippase [Patescibacteria group bacterium]MCL5431665.1 flippase [Patescibacteria group bacterium]